MNSLRNDQLVMEAVCYYTCYVVQSSCSVWERGVESGVGGAYPMACSARTYIQLFSVTCTIKRILLNSVNNSTIRTDKFFIFSVKFNNEEYLKIIYNWMINALVLGPNSTYCTCTS